MRNRLAAKSHVKSTCNSHSLDRQGWLFRWHFLVPFKTKPPRKPPTKHQMHCNSMQSPYIPSPPKPIFSLHDQPNPTNKIHPIIPTTHPTTSPAALQPNAFARWVSSSIFPLASRNASWSEALAPNELKSIDLSGVEQTHTRLGKKHWSCNKN